MQQNNVAMWSQPKDNLFVKEHDYYYTPSDYYIRSILKRMGHSSNNSGIVSEMSRFFYYKMIQDPDYIKEEYLTPTDEMDIEEIEGKKDFYQNLWDIDFIPGNSPLEKALYVLDSSMKEQDGSEMEPSKMNFNQFKTNIPDKDQYNDTTLNKLLTNRKSIDNFKRVQLIQKICLVNKFGSKFEVKKTVTEKRVSNSDIHKLKRIVEYGELPNAPLYQRVFPNYMTKLLAKDLHVNTPIKRDESKQKIIMLVDFSGSMCTEYKQDWVLSILSDRLRYCMKGECEIFFSYFLTKHDILRNRFKFTHIKTEAEALDFFKNFNVQPSGGDTEIGHVVEEIRKEIEENKKLFNLDVDLSKEKPEILIINDGDDTVKTDKLTWKTNAITIGRKNTELETLCNQTEGKYILLED